MCFIIAFLYLSHFMTGTPGMTQYVSRDEQFVAKLLHIVTQLQPRTYRHCRAETTYLFFFYINHTIGHPLCLSVGFANI